MIETISTLFTIPPFVAIVAISSVFFICCAIARVNPFRD